ncbi:MAG: BGTF surface domain-containing protein [Haloplanus sp.]
MGRRSTTRRTRSRLRSAGVVLVCSLLLAAAAGTGIGAAQEADGLRFANAVTTEQRGDVAEIPILVGDRQHVTLSVRAPDGTYETRVRAVDADDDGRITVEIDTFRAGWVTDESTAYAAGDGDRLTSVSRRTSRLRGPLPKRRYNLVVAAGSESTSATLALRPGTVGSATAATLPAEWSGNATTVSETPRFETGRVAIDDHAVVTFNASGIGGLVGSSAPGTNLVYPTDSMPGASTTHTVSVDADRQVTPETITIRYGEGGAPQTLGRFDVDRIRHLGIDTDGDGIVETDLRPAVTGVEPGERAVTVTLDTDASVAANETLLLQYRATNPTATGAYGVHAVVEGRKSVAVDGRVVYGVAGRGTLGYGLDLRVGADGEETVVDPLAAVDYHYADDRLYAVVNTSTLTVGERYSVGLIRWGVSPLGSDTRAASADIRITDRQATLVQPSPDDPFVVSPSETTFRAKTTLAPTTEVVVEVSGAPPNSFLFRQSTRVSADRTLSARFDLGTATARKSITVRIVDNGTLLEREDGAVGE